MKTFFSLRRVLVIGMAMASLPCPAANLLVNPSFEQNSGNNIPAGWTRFAPPGAGANYWIEPPAKEGTYSWKQWGATYKVGETNIAGLYQQFSSAAGSRYDAGGWFFTKGSDTLGVNCRTWIQVEFLGASSNLLALFKTPDFQRTEGTDIWVWQSATQACDVATIVPSGDPLFTTYAVTGTVSQIVAPPGTATVRLRYAYAQANNEGGAGWVDAVVLDQVSGSLPPVISDLAPQNMIFVNPAEGITFKATSPSGYTIEPSGISLVLNGADVSSGLQVTGTASSKNVAYYGLQSNKTYTTSIAVRDTSGFTASANTTFETMWLGLPPLVYIWEAEDYDFEGGKYINGPVYCTNAGVVNCYYEKAGVSDVDFHSVIFNDAHFYRTADPIAIKAAADWLRKPLASAGRTDYRIDPFIGGEWINYTRDWSNGTYWISARLATGEGLSGQLTLSQVNADSSTTDLGTFTIASGRGWSTYDNVFLRDTNGNIANVVLNGKVTLRVTSGGNLLPNFFMASAAQLDLPMMTGLYPNGSRAFEHTNTLRFQLTTGAGATFPPGSIKLNLNGVDVTSRLVITGSDTAKQVQYTNLLPNAVHTAVIMVTNSLGNGLSVTNRFDTFSEENFMVEAEDYNYDGGQYFTEWLPGGYASMGALTNVDYQHTTLEGESWTYRPAGVPQEIARDDLRQIFVTYGGIDYHLAWFGGGDWANYTRVFPENMYHVWVRSGGFGAYRMELDEVVSGAKTATQVTRRLGQFSQLGKDNQTHEWVPLTDAGAPIAVRLGGETTLRLGTSTGNAHPSYLMFVMAQGIALTATRAGNETRISFPTQTGVLYRVFARTSLTSGDWQLMTTVVGDGGVQSVTENAPLSVGQRYYKVSAP